MLMATNLGKKIYFCIDSRKCQDLYADATILGKSKGVNDMYVPEKPRKKCTGFSYIGPKLYNMVPKNIKEAKTADDFKNKLKYGKTSINLTNY